MSVLEGGLVFQPETEEPVYADVRGPDERVVSLVEQMCFPLRNPARHPRHLRHDIRERGVVQAGGYKYRASDFCQPTIEHVAVCAAAVERKQAAANIRRNAPNPIPMGLIARLAVTEQAKGQRIGSSLLREAIFRIINAGEHIGIRGILVHAMDEDAANFYRHMGFGPSPIDEMTLMISIGDIRHALAHGTESAKPGGRQSTTG